MDLFIVLKKTSEVEFGWRLVMDYMFHMMYIISQRIIVSLLFIMGDIQIQLFPLYRRHCHHHHHNFRRNHRKYDDGNNDDRRTRHKYHHGKK